MYNPIKEHRKEIISNINKAFDDVDMIEKAKWQIGEVRVDSRGIAHECYEYTSEGKPRLRRVKKQKGAVDTTGVKSNGLTTKNETKIENNLRSQLDKLFPDKLGKISKIKIEKKNGLWNNNKEYIEATVDSASTSKSPHNTLFVRSVVRSKDGGNNWEVINSGLMRYVDALKDDEKSKSKI